MSSFTLASAYVFKASAQPNYRPAGIAGLRSAGDAGHRPLKPQDWSRSTDAAAPATGGIYPDGVLGLALDPRLHSGAEDRRALSLGAQMMGRAPDQHRPSRARRQVDLVDLQGDVVIGARDAGKEILVGKGVLVHVP